MATAQELFSKVYRHAMAQNARAMTIGGKCVYSTHALHHGDSPPEGPDRRCFVGCLIPDGHVGLLSAGSAGQLLRDSPDLESALIASDMSRFSAAGLLEYFQHVHDFQPVKDWPHALHGIANDYNLKVPTTQPVEAA